MSELNTNNRIEKLGLSLVSEREDALTFKDLYDSIKDEIETYEKEGMLEDLMNQKVSVNLYDHEGNIVYGDLSMLIGWCNRRVVATGHINGVIRTGSVVEPNANIKDALKYGEVVK